MQDEEIIRIIKCSIPKLLSSKEEVTQNNEEQYNITDVNKQLICNLWAGMGHIYKVTFTLIQLENDSEVTGSDQHDDIDEINRKGTVTMKSTTLNAKKKRHKVLNSTSSVTTSSRKSLIVKHIVLPEINQLDKDANLDFDTVGDIRKKNSYYVEANFYDKLAPLLCQTYNLAIPIPYYIEQPIDLNDNNDEKQQNKVTKENHVNVNKKSNREDEKNEIIISMSYVENDRQLLRKISRIDQRNAVLSWLANFHAIFWGSKQADDAVRTYGLQMEGSYWYYNTRQYEHNQMSNDGWIGRLKYAAKAISDYLQYRDIYQCIIHGDAKEANILYGSTNATAKHADNDNVHDTKNGIAATFCDFQYCGKGSFTKDLVYYLMRFDSHKSNSEDDIDDALTFYLHQLSSKLTIKSQSMSVDVPIVIPTLKSIQISFSLAYCDLYRFMIGWGYWGSSSSSVPKNRRVMKVLDQLDNGKQFVSIQEYDKALRREFG